MNVANLISGSSASLKLSLYIWKFSIQVLLKASLKDFDHYLANMWNEQNCMVVWTFFGTNILWDWNETWPFPGLWRLLSFPNLLAYWVQYFKSIIFSVLFSSVAQSCLTLCDPMNRSLPDLPVHHQLLSLPKLMSIESVMPSNHLICCPPLLLLPSIFPSIKVFSSESTLCIRWPTYWSFSFYISSSNEHPGLISFRMDWLDFLAVQGTLKSILQHYSSKASILWCSAFFIVQLSHPYMTTVKTIASTRRTFVGKVMALLFNMLSRLVTTFLPGSKLYVYSITINTY